MKKNKKKVIDKANETKHPPLNYTENIVYKKQNKRDKLSPRFKADVLSKDIMKDHHKINTIKGVYTKHKIKRPKKLTKKSLLQAQPCKPSTSSQPSTSALEIIPPFLTPKIRKSKTNV